MESVLKRLVQSTRDHRKVVGSSDTSQNRQDDDSEQDEEEWRSALDRLAAALEAALPLFAAEGGGGERGGGREGNDGGEDDGDDGDDAYERYDATEKAPPTAGEEGLVLARWLLDLCRDPDLQAATLLDPLYLAKSVAEVAAHRDENGDDGGEGDGSAAQQSALFDLLGATSDASLRFLLEITPRLREIGESVTAERLDRAAATTTAAPSDSAPFDAGHPPAADLEEERRQLLVLEALDAAHIAALAQAEVDAIAASGGSGGGPGGSTHAVQRASDRRAIRTAEKAAERARKALQRAREAGAVLDESDLLAVDRSSLSVGAGGMMHRTPDEVAALQRALLPEGSREYYGDRGLPRGTIHETDRDGTQRVIIPPAERDESQLPSRLAVRDVLDPEIAKAFVGTTSLNPMQSAVFETAFHSRENVLVCGTFDPSRSSSRFVLAPHHFFAKTRFIAAPTGAGKTNVALLAATAHFRDVGLIGKGRIQLEAGAKVVYIAPMKALAQEVVEKFESKLRPLGLVVRELTGDMQLTRAEAAAAHVLVTVRAPGLMITSSPCFLQ
jgi:hypothetical protein